MNLETLDTIPAALSSNLGNVTFFIGATLLLFEIGEVRHTSRARTPDRVSRSEIAVRALLMGLTSYCDNKDWEFSEFSKLRV